MSIKIIALLFLLSVTFPFLKAQNLLSCYKGGELQFYNDIHDGITIERCCYNQETKSHYCRAFIYVSEDGNIDSVSFKKLYLNKYDSMVLNAILKTSKNWQKSNEKIVVYFSAWFLNNETDKIELNSVYTGPIKTKWAEKVIFLEEFLFLFNNIIGHKTAEK